MPFVPVFDLEDELGLRVSGAEPVKLGAFSDGGREHPEQNSLRYERGAPTSARRSLARGDLGWRSSLAVILNRAASRCVRRAVVLKFARREFT
ncbi:hypothetical protein WMF26_31570 [Sorangium sp. So ce185]|uniref:hypothetical protein n=1 Tax=Sorangium sp. So ce185 TaxID=3133287 RepID=UPI003F6357C7